MRLEGKVALITGGNSGIGFATAQQFVKEGAYVFITGRSQTKLDEAVKRVGSNVTGVQGDVSKLEDLDRLFAQIKKEKGRLDIVFANAGIAKYAPLGAIDEAPYDSIFDGNVKGMLFTVQKALPLMPDGASIILNASVVGSKGLPSNSVYSATKAAIRSFARTWTTDLKARHIRVNAISPGPIATEGLYEYRIVNRNWELLCMEVYSDVNRRRPIRRTSKKSAREPFIIPTADAAPRTTNLCGNLVPGERSEPSNRLRQSNMAL